jgi:S1-C subfamily serine protease
MTDESFESADADRTHDTPPIPLPPVPGPASDPVAPTGAYALGALTGNPLLGPPAGGGYAGPPTSPVMPGWAPPPSPGTPPPSSHRMRNSLIGTGTALVLLAAGVAIGHGAWTVKTQPAVSAPSHNSVQSPSGSGSGGESFGSGTGGLPFGSGSSGFSSTSSGPKDVSAIAAKVDPGLVDIDTSLGYQQEEAAGTGIVLTPTGEILTNNHVIEGATTISVTDVGNHKTYSASVVGYDRTQDIAVLQLHNASGLQTSTIGDSSKAAVGEDVVGIGNAGGTGGTPSAAGGTVTALNQSITASDEGDASSEQLTNLIETNADIQAGDSGGSLVDTSGQIIGMDTAASAGFSFESQGENQGNQGYAIPINEAITLAKQIENGTSTANVHIGATAFLGVEVESTSSNGFSGGFGNGSSSSGAEVFSAITSSPAQEAGLAQGDIITSVDGQTVSSPQGLTNLLAPYHPGDKVKIGWTDTSGQTHTSTVQLTSGPPQ